MREQWQSFTSNKLKADHKHLAGHLTGLIRSPPSQQVRHVRHVRQHSWPGGSSWPPATGRGPDTELSSNIWMWGRRTKAACNGWLVVESYTLSLSGGVEQVILVPDHQTVNWEIGNRFDWQKLVVRCVAVTSERSLHLSAFTYQAVHGVLVCDICDINLKSLILHENQ